MNRALVVSTLSASLLLSVSVTANAGNSANEPFQVASSTAPPPAVNRPATATRDHRSTSPSRAPGGVTVTPGKPRAKKQTCVRSTLGGPTVCVNP